MAIGTDKLELARLRVDVWKARALALEGVLVRLLDNLETGSYESTNQAAEEAKQVIGLAALSAYRDLAAYRGAPRRET